MEKVNGSEYFPNALYVGDTVLRGLVGFFTKLRGGLITGVIKLRLKGQEKILSHSSSILLSPVSW